MSSSPSLYTVPEIFKGSWHLVIPNSKSLTNRAIHLASLAEGESLIDDILDSSDTNAMIESHALLGAVFERLGTALKVFGHGTFFHGEKSKSRIYVAGAGTVARFVSAALSLSDREFLVEGDRSMNLRPMRELLDLLVDLGASIQYLNTKGNTPFIIKGPIQNLGSQTVLSVPGHRSSQFLSALMMIGPYFKNGLKLRFPENIVSLPYVKMTSELMKVFGADCELQSKYFYVAPGSYHGTHYKVEIDYSSASFFLCLAAISGSEITLLKADKKSLQGDKNLLDILEKMGCQVVWKEEGVFLKGPKQLRPLVCDMKDMTDTVPALAAACLFAPGLSLLENLSHMEFKECNRPEALVKEFKKLGANISYEAGSLRIIGGKTYFPSTLETYEDHRMAMAFSVAGSQVPGTKILNPGCVSKTFPNFFEILEKCRSSFTNENANKIKVF